MWFDFDTIEEMTINDIDMIRYEGSVVNKDKDSEDGERRTFIVMYHFIVEGRPFTLTGHLSTYSQSEEEIDELRSNVDKCARTIRKARNATVEPFGEKQYGESSFLGETSYFDAEAFYNKSN